MTVTTGERGTRSSSRSTSSVSAMASCTSALTKSTWKPNSSATTVRASASRRWLMDTGIPRLMQVPMTFTTGTFIIVANSLAVTNSVTFKTFLSSSWRIISSIMVPATCWRFSRRCFEVFDLPMGDRRAKVSLICFEISSSLSSGFSSRFIALFLSFLLKGLPLSFGPFLPKSPPWFFGPLPGLPPC